MASFTLLTTVPGLLVAETRHWPPEKTATGNCNESAERMCALNTFQAMGRAVETVIGAVGLVGVE